MVYVCVPGILDWRCNHLRFIVRRLFALLDFEGMENGKWVVGTGKWRE